MVKRQATTSMQGFESIRIVSCLEFALRARLVNRLSLLPLSLSFSAPAFFITCDAVSPTTTLCAYAADRADVLNHPEPLIRKDGSRLGNNSWISKMARFKCEFESQMMKDLWLVLISYAKSRPGN